MKEWDPLSYFLTVFWCLSVVAYVHYPRPFVPVPQDPINLNWIAPDSGDLYTNLGTFTVKHLNYMFISGIPDTTKLYLGIATRANGYIYEYIGWGYSNHSPDFSSHCFAIRGSYRKW